MRRHIAASASVTVLENGPRIMGREDADIADQIERILGDEGIEFIIGSDVVNVTGRSGAAVSVCLRTRTGMRRIDGTDILVAAGCVPNTAGIGLDLAGIALVERRASARCFPACRHTDASEHPVGEGC